MDGVVTSNQCVIEIMALAQGSILINNRHHIIQLILPTSSKYDNHTYEEGRFFLLINENSNICVVANNGSGILAMIIRVMKLIQDQVSQNRK